MNSKIYNVVILDKSGSMSSIRQQAIDGVNETFGSIRSTHKKNPEQEQFVTLVAFCGCELKTIYENTPIDEVQNITAKDYVPCCMTPLYDAVGNTITRLHTQVTGDESAGVAVTIITDGYENASREFTGKALKALIEAYKNEGWMFAYIGADHDVEAVAFDLSIDNAIKFDKTAAGTHAMFEFLNDSRAQFSADIECSMEAPTAAERLNAKKKASKGFFRKF